MNIIKRVTDKIRRLAANKSTAKRYCNICYLNFEGPFLPLPSMYFESVQRTGYPYTFDDAETLNYKEYNCPGCRSTDRDRLYALFLKKYLPVDRVVDLLDIAPNAALSKFLKNNPLFNYRSADLLMEGVDDIIDIMDMWQYRDNKFDLFICSHVLEHVMDDKKAMQELLRVLKPGGAGIAMVPIVLPLKEIDEDSSITDPEQRWKRFGQNDHVRLYSKQGYIERLRATGFTVREYTVKDFSSKTFLLYGISPKSVLYIVSK
ncbi:MAG: class I SAM-dependent methyltransferase [Ferruginibacter sp.]